MKIVWEGGIWWDIKGVGSGEERGLRDWLCGWSCRACSVAEKAEGQRRRVEQRMRMTGEGLIVVVDVARETHDRRCTWPQA